MIGSHSEFVASAEQLATEARRSGGASANSETASFLEAMEGWLGDSGKYHAKAGRAVDTERPDWDLFADAFAAATIYERPAKRGGTMFIGELFVGSGPNAAHINVVLGPRDGPVGFNRACRSSR